MKKIELKPCPACGKPVKIKSHFGDLIIAHDRKEHEEDYPLHYCLSGRMCIVTTIEAEKWTRNRLAKWWNGETE